MKTLIVDDNANARKLLRMILERHGCEAILEARDGQEGLEMARLHRPDLIISDAMMPRMDGFELLRAVKTDAELKGIPFVFHSSVYTGTRDEDLASRLGAEGFITKPKDPEEFWAELSRVLDRVASGAKQSPPDESMDGESEYLREYSGVVAAKLEEKVRELEESLARRKEAEEALRASERFLNNIVENIPNMIFVKDARDLHYIMFNKAGEELLGNSRQELTGKNDYDLFPAGVADIFAAKSGEALRNGSLLDIPEQPISTRHKGERLLHTRIIPIRDEAGVPQYLLGISEDITERKRAEEELHKLSAAIEQSPVSILITDAMGRIEFVNPKFTQVTGYAREEALGENPRFIKSGETAPEEYQRLWDTITAGHVWHGELHNRKKNGELFWEYATISPVKSRQGGITHYIALKEDITERKLLEEQLRHAQKMEAVGTLAAGVAHDFNNILTAIIGFGSMLDMKMEKDDPLHQNVAQILIAADRAANLTRSLLAFGRVQPVETKQADLNQIVIGIGRMLGRLLREDVELRLDLYQESLPALVDVGQIEQVLLNLTTNARDAIPRVGTITISTGLAGGDEEIRNLNGQGKSENYAVITFTDSGAGMDERTRQRIFEPFFTTKEVGKGTGLGLSICYGIVKQHGGDIRCISEPGKGTTFRIYLPLLQEIDARGDATSAAPFLRGTETILVAEDDPTVRNLTASILREFGYSVIEAQDGEDAVARFRERPEEIDLCLLDAIMPKKGGWESYEEIKSIRPDVKALLMSGYQSDSTLQKRLAAGGSGFIAKPAPPRELLRKVREVLDGGEFSKEPSGP